MSIDEDDSDVTDASGLEGLDKGRADLTKWISRHLKDADVEEGFKILLFKEHRGVPVEIDGYRFELDDSVSEKVSEILESASEVAENLRGRTKFYIKIPGKTGRAQFSLHLVGEDGTNTDDDNDDEPNERGLVSSALRHTEQMTKITVGLVRDNRDDDREAMRELREENRELRRQVSEGFKLREEMLSAKQIRDIEFDKYKRGEERKAEGMKIVKQIVPVLMHKLTAGEAPSQVPAVLGERSPPEMMVASLLESFTPEQQNKLLEILSQPQLATLFEIQSYNEMRKNQGQAQAAPVSPPTAQYTPPSDSNGAPYAGM
jgi:hypothetical protein